jgi:hypothetical protein
LNVKHVDNNRRCRLTVLLFVNRSILWISRHTHTHTGLTFLSVNPSIFCSPPPLKSQDELDVSNIGRWDEVHHSTQTQVEAHPPHIPLTFPFTFTLVNSPRSTKSPVPRFPCSFHPPSHNPLSPPHFSKHNKCSEPATILFTSHPSGIVIGALPSLIWSSWE